MYFLFKSLNQCIKWLLLQIEALNLFLHDRANLSKDTIPNTVSVARKPKWNSDVSKPNHKSCAFTSLSDEFMQTKLHHQHALNNVRSKRIRAEETVKQSTVEWLENYGLKAKHLTINDFVAMGRISESRMRKFNGKFN
ncbi:unnamed protein product [Trichobilharzia regenti]|nr:unnamed protein product [Trichobilharzia regenti]